MAQVFSSTKQNNNILSNAIKTRLGSNILPPLNNPPTPMRQSTVATNIQQPTIQTKPQAVTLPPKTQNTAPTGSKAVQSSYTSAQPVSSTRTTSNVSSVLPIQPIAPVNNQYSGLYGRIINNLSNVGTDKVTGSLKNIYDLQNDYATKLSGLQSKGLDIGYGTGASNILQTAYNNRLSALQQGLSNTLEAQGQQISALGTAGGLAAPVSVAPGTTLTDPVTGEMVAGGLGGYANYRTAEQVFSQASQYKDAVNAQGQPFTYNESLTPQQNWQVFSTQYLPNSRTYQSSLISSGLPSNIGRPQSSMNPLAESTINQSNIAGYDKTYQEYQNLNTQYDGAKNLGSLLVKTMQDGGINTADPKILNFTINQLKSQMSDKDYQRFTSTLANVQSAYANILATGGGTIPTAATEALDKIIDPNASFGAIQAAINQLNQEVVDGKLAPLANQVNTYLQNISPQSQYGGSSLYDF